MSEPKGQLETYRLSAESELAAATQTDQVTIHFDWIAGVEDGRVTFKVRVDRQGKSSRIDLEIDLLKLSANELERLQNFLVRRHAGITSDTEVVAAASWLLDCSLKQVEAGSCLAERQTKIHAPLAQLHERAAAVRQLLLAASQ